VDAMLTANLFKRGQANPQLFRNLLFGKMKKLLKLRKLDVAPGGHADPRADGAHAYF
jgi:hypothetical protein